MDNIFHLQNFANYGDEWNLSESGYGINSSGSSTPLLTIVVLAKMMNGASGTKTYTVNWCFRYLMSGCCEKDETACKFFVCLVLICAYLLPKYDNLVQYSDAMIVRRKILALPAVGLLLWKCF